MCNSFNEVKSTYQLMKQLPIILGLTLLLATSCNNHSKTNNEDLNKLSVDTNTIPDEENKDTSVFTPLWEYQYDTIIKDFRIVKLQELNNDTLTAESVVNIVNKSWPDVQVKYIKTSKDTVYISIPESTILTQQMGSAGAKQFMVSATYSFTELKGIKYVSFKFKVGDHANPGVYSRNSWKN